MKLTTEITIDLPINEVISLFDNPDNLRKWQPELVSFENISGEPGQVGAKSKLKYKIGLRETEIIETITKRNLPHEFSGTYETGRIFNSTTNKFYDLNGIKTKWVAENEFRFSGIMSIISLVMKKFFTRQTEQYFKQFKEFAENEIKRQNPENLDS